MDNNERNIIDEHLKIADGFNREISKLIRLTDKVHNNTAIDRLKRLIKLGKDDNPLVLIESCKDTLWKFRDYISEENEAFFLNNEFTDDANSDNKGFIDEVIALFKQKYIEFTGAERHVIWKIIKAMLTYSIKYMLID